MQATPWVFISLTIATLIPASESAGPRGTHALLVLAWLLLAGLEFGFAARRRQPIMLTRFDLVPILLLGWAGASTAIRGGAADARTSLNVFWLFCSWTAAYLVARQCFRDAARCRALVLVLALACVGQAAAGMWQRQVLQPRAWSDYQAHADEVLASQGIPTEPGNIHRAAFESRLQANQPAGTFLHPNSLAGLLAVGIVLAAAMGVAATTTRQRIAWFILLGAMGVVLLFTGGRAALVAATLGLVALAWLERPDLRSRPRWMLAGLLVAAIAAGGWLVVSPGAASAVKSLVMRTEYWQATAEMIASHPWLGCGLGNFQDYYASVRPPTASEVVADPHNVWLEIAATCGLPALGLWTFFLMLSARRIWPAALAFNASDAIKGESVPPRSPRWRNEYTAALLGLAIGLLSAAVRLRMPDLRLVGVGLVAAAIAALLVHGRSAYGVAWKKGVWLAPWVLLVHLQVSGGILYPGLAAPLWILLALGCNLASPSSAASIPPAAPTPVHKTNRWFAAGLAGAAMVATACAHFTMFRPLHLADTRLAQAELAYEAGDVRLALELAAEASRGDPWSGAVARRRLEMAWRSPSPGDRFAAEQTARRLNPRSPALHGWLGNMCLLDHRRSGSRADLERAIVEYEAVVSLYPNAAVAWAQLAYALQLHGERTPQMKEAAREALRLDERQVHAEQKLSSQSLFDDPAPAGTARDWAERCASSRSIRE